MMENNSELIAQSIDGLADAVRQLAESITSYQGIHGELKLGHEVYGIDFGKEIARLSNAVVDIEEKLE